MKRYLVHPLRPQGFSFVPNTDVVAALLECDSGRGTIEVLLPEVAASLRSLFEEPLQDDGGKTLEPWTPQALAYLLETELPRSGWAAVAVS